MNIAQNPELLDMLASRYAVGIKRSSARSHIALAGKNARHHGTALPRSPQPQRVETH